MPRNNRLAGALAGCVTLALLLAPNALAKKPRAKGTPAMAGAAASIDLPPGDDVLPDRPNAEAVDRNCLSCHSPEIVVNQPSLSRAQWTAEVNKMRQVYGAAIPDDDMQAILNYLVSLRGEAHEKWR